MTTSKPDEEQDIETGGEATAVTKNNTTNKDLNAAAAAAAGDNDNKTTAVATTEGGGGDGKKKKTKKQSATSDGEGRTSMITMDEEGGVNVAVGGVNIGINQMRLPLVGMLVSSVVLLVAVVSWKGPPMWKSTIWRGYAIAYPCVTLVISFMGILMTCKKEFYLNNGKFIHVFLFLWNFVGACLLTFFNPFTQTGNGYFAAWGTVVCAAGALGIRGDTFTSGIRGLGCILGLISSSIVVLIAMTDYVGPSSFFRYEAIYGMVVCCCTLFVFLLFIVDEKRRLMNGGGGQNDGIFHVIMLSIFAVLWVALAGISTFRGPFLMTGNGYFASWTGAACACYAVTATRKQKKEKE